MTSEWQPLVAEFEAAARTLIVDAGHWRSSLNRSYYSAFSEVTRCLHLAGVTMPNGWEGPRHASVYNGTLISNHLNKWLKPEEIGKLIHLIYNLYRLRRIADYEASVTVTEADARQGLDLLREARLLLERTRE